ncbi:dephospho-CoA kinase [Parasulfitobacter algicola]|uniref:Dephospho-CoA kinase n=1 Tax=Parasulfitobacter algicola TaxID=2614809 RepID=A0ABX2IL63_9RHOB|nr:dephospho-CoA kinase [Sulfitobacter algicola]NSX53584.1 dephospho-CoA kinase [Sulfitobacter algicola]
MTHIIGLTGSIGMGKSTTAAMFEKSGIPVWDADSTVHQLYAKGGAAVGPIGIEFPDAVKDGGINRSTLKSIIQSDPTVLKRIEQIVHPLVAQERQKFIQETQSDIIVLDIPLLFETGADQWVDTVVCVSVSADIQRNRVLERPGMTASQLDMILSKQMPNEEKCKQADFVVETETLNAAQIQVDAIIQKIKGQIANA